MKTLKTLFLALLLVVATSSMVEAQTVTARTTLTTATTNTTGTETLTVGSTTNWSASPQSFVLIDGELMQVVSVNSSTSVTVRRASQGVASPHAAGAEVRWGRSGQWNNSTGITSGAFIGSSPFGTCTRASQQFLPVFRVSNDRVIAYDCPNSVTSSTGKWISWEYYPGTSQVGAINTVPCQAGSTTACTSYTALVSDYIISISTEFTPDNATFTVTLPCSSVPAGKIWIVNYTGLGAGTTGNGVSI